jgi:hypothetical protein
VIKLGLMQATWAWVGIILFMILGFTKIIDANPKGHGSKVRVEKAR